MTINDLLRKCEIAYGENDYEKVIGLCDEILKDDLNNQIALGYKTRCLYFLDEYESALTLLDNALVLFPKNYRYLQTRGEVLMLREEYDKALECFERIFEIGVSDEAAAIFIRQDWEICLSLKIDCLIEREKYVEAWKCHNRLLDMESQNPEPFKRFEMFKRLVDRRTGNSKFRHYYVKPSSHEAGVKLTSFLDENGFECDGAGGLLSIDVVDKTCRPASVNEVGCKPIISESKFYDKVNYYPKSKIERKEIFDEYGNLLYGGYALYDVPYGFGKVYFENGSLYREGIFDIKGIVQGKEYYPSGQLRFEGQWSLTTGYGPNVPYDGNAYSEDGELIYSGKFKIRWGGVGWPVIQNPKGFSPEQKERPKIKYYWEVIR